MGDDWRRDELPWSIKLTFTLLATACAVSLVLWGFQDAGLLTSKLVDVWAPHVAASTFELLIAAAVLDRLFRRQDAERLYPLQKAALERLRRVLSRLLSAVVTQYAYIGPERCDAPTDRSTMVEKWMIALGDAKQAWLPQLFAELDRCGVALDTISQRYGHLLESATLTLIEQFIDTWNDEEGMRLRASYELARAASPRFGASNPAERQITASQLILIRHIVGVAMALVDHYEDLAKIQIELGADIGERFERARLGREALAQS
jgi:hypothetical protein